MAKKINEATLTILSRVTVEGNAIFLTCGQLDRKQYIAVNEVLENMSGKWDKKTKSHVFSEDPTDKLDAILLTGEIVPPEEHGVYFTPPKLAEYVIKQSGVKSGDMVMEPSTGQGSLAWHLALITSLTNVHCHELLPENVKVLEEKGLIVKQGDFLGENPTGDYDCVVMNPPFRVNGKQQADIDHVLHAWEFLKPSGRLTAIMSAGVLFRDNKKTVAFRDMVSEHGSMERLPENSFKESG